MSQEVFQGNIHIKTPTHPPEFAYTGKHVTARSVLPESLGPPCDFCFRFRPVLSSPELRGLIMSEPHTEATLKSLS